jgi:hypothetical protein
MALDTGFVVAVLEGIESTLDELIECSDRVRRDIRTPGQLGRASEPGNCASGID